MARARFNVSQCFRFRWINNHPIIQTSSGNLLLDTGLPLTVTKEGVNLPLTGLKFGQFDEGKEKEGFINVLKQIKRDLEEEDEGSSLGDLLRLAGKNMIDPEKLLEECSKYIGIEIGALVGTDYLEDIDVSIDPLSETVLFMTPVGREVSYSGVMVDIEMDKTGVPLIDFQLGGQRHKAIFDTGAQISYAKTSLIEGLQPVERAVRDFYPFVGSFTTDIYSLDISIAGMSVPMRFGILPEGLADSLKMLGDVSIIGIELLRSFAIHLSLRDGFVILNPLQERIFEEGTKERWLQRFRATPTQYLRDSYLLEEFKKDFVGDEEIISQIKKRMLFVSPGRTQEYLRRLLELAEGKGY